MDKNNLPSEIAVFPLSNAIFFPRTILPLNIFEDRYLKLVKDCMKKDKLFGMIQPKTRIGVLPEVYNIGCLGKIISFNETADKRFLITLSGIIRFRIKEEINKNKLYRNFKVDYSDFFSDLEEENNQFLNQDKKKILNKIRLYFQKIDYPIDYSKLEKLNLDQLISTICMVSPFSVQEKQKLIEIIEIKNKIKILDEIINFSLLDGQDNKMMQ